MDAVDPRLQLNLARGLQGESTTLQIFLYSYTQSHAHSALPVGIYLSSQVCVCVCVLRHERQTLGVSKSLLGISQHWKRRYRQKFIDYFNNNAFTGVSFCYTHEERNIFGVDR
jgi:hypothetical protein